MAAGPRRPVRPAAPTLALLAGLVYALAEYLRQRAVPSPPGVPGDSGASLPALVALGLVGAGGPALLFGALSSGRRLREFLALAAAAWPFAAAGLWRALDRAGVLAGAPDWTPTRFVLPGLGLALLAALVALVPTLRWPVRWRLRRRVVLAVVALASVGLGLQLRPPARPDRPTGDGPNLLLVTIDTMRRDALARYGGPWPTALDSVGGTAHEGWAVSSWTQPSMASLFSGTVPTGHGSDPQHGPDPAVDWWPEQIRASGRRTAAFVTNPYLRRRFGFDRGFSTFDHSEERPWLEPVARTVLAEWLQAGLNAREDADRADTIVGRALRWLDGPGADGPWFLWVHLLDPHLPYALRGSGGRATADSVPAWFAPLAGEVGERGFDALQPAREGQAVQSEAARSALRRLYQTDVAYAAWWTRRLLAAAREASGPRPLVWVVTSDHGEEFFEEGGFEHGHTLADPVVRVPLLADGLGEAPVALRLVDLGPRILARVAPGAAFDPAQGSKLLESDVRLQHFALGRPTDPPRVCDRPVMMAEGLLYGPTRTRFTLEDGTVVERVDPSGRPRQLQSCPEVAPGEPVGAPWTELDLWRERRGNSPLRLEVDDDLRRQLRALGYVN